MECSGARSDWHRLSDLVAKLIVTYVVALLELHDELLETLVRVQQLFLACVEQDLNKSNISWLANFVEKIVCRDSPCTRDLRPRSAL